MQKSKHSKFKNTGLLFELLSRQITADVMSDKETSPAKDLLFKFFNENTELGKEQELYRFLVNEKINGESKADRAISIVLKSREKLNSKKLAEEKYNLIKELKQHYPLEDLLKASIKNYKEYASVYKLFENHVSDQKFPINEIIQARNCLVESLIRSKVVPNKEDEEIYEYYQKQDEDVRLLSYQFMVDNFNKKYENFDDNQKQILREYINNISNTNSLTSFLYTQVTKIKDELSTLSKNIDSQITKIKITEVMNQLDKINASKGVKDNHVTVLLLSYDLINEIKKQI